MTITTEVYEIQWPQEGWSARVFDTLDDAIYFAETKHGDLAVWRRIPNQNCWYPQQVGERQLVDSTAEHGPNICLKTLTGQV